MRALLGGIAAVLIAAPAFADDLVIRDFVGTITVATGPLDVEVRRDHDDLDIDTGSTLRIDGGFSDPAKSGVCGSYGSWWGGRIKATDIEDYAELAISVPDGASVVIENSIIRLDTRGTTLGRAEFGLRGCFDAALGDMLEAEIGKSGSGDLSAGQVGTLQLGKSGSGDVRIADVGTLDLGKSGSGDVRVERIGVSGKIAKSGSGRVEIGYADGPLTLGASGSGDIRVADGTIPRLKISASGSGDITIDADVGDATISKSGSGGVKLARVSGELEQSTSGSARVTVGSRD